MNRPLVLKLQIPYPTRKDGKGDEVLVDIEVKLSPMFIDPYYAKRHGRFNKWDVQIVEVPVGMYPNGKQRKVLGRYLYNEISKAGYDVKEATTAIGNKIIERYDGDF